MCEFMKTFEISIKTNGAKKIKYKHKAPNIEHIVDWAKKFYSNTPKFKFRSIEYFKKQHQTTADNATQAVISFENWNGFFTLIITEK